MDKLDLARRPEAVDADWLTTALRQAGVLGEARVSAVKSREVGAGMIGDSYRFELTYDGPAPGAPASVVGKFPAIDPVSKQTGVGMGLYAREVAFYREMAASVAIITPRAFVAEYDAETGDFVLLMEDLAPARQGDQLSGCSLKDAETAMLEAAALHGPRWADPALDAFAWLNRRSAGDGTIEGLLPGVTAAFRERYEDMLEPEFMALCLEVPAVITAFNAHAASPTCVQHGDYRLDNVLFDVQGGAKRMATLDWQTVGAGPGMLDVSYFLSAGLPPAERRANEVELVRAYHAELQRFGVTGYGWDHCWSDYQRFAVHGVFMAVFSSIVVERTPRGDQMFMAMARGACAQALEHKAFDFWR